MLKMMIYTNVKTHPPLSNYCPISKNQEKKYDPWTIASSEWAI